MAFQGNSFQGNAFQVGIPGGGTAVVMDADSATYNWTANAVTFDTSLSTASASYAYSATAATLDTSMSAAAASFAYTANAVTFDASLLVASASYAWTASAVTFDTSMLAASAAYTWTANDADLVVTTGVVMDANSASYSYSAQAVTFDTSFSVETSSYSWTANDATLTTEQGQEDVLPIGAGSYQGYRDDNRWKKRRRQLEKLDRLLRGIKDELPSDVPEAQVARKAEATVAQAINKLGQAPFPAFDNAGLAADLRRARAEVAAAQTALEDYHARKQEEEDDEDLLLMLG